MRRRFVSSVLFLTLCSVWSLGSMVSAAWQAQRFAAGTPYCIAHTRGPEDYSVIGRWRDLLGMRFYTQKTGFKDASRWYFHAVLHTPEQPHPYWNWSVARMRFMPVERYEWQLVRLNGGCVPQMAFLGRLSW